MKKWNMRKAALALLAGALMLGVTACGSKMAYDTAASEVWSNSSVADAGFGGSYGDDDYLYDMEEPAEVESSTESGAGSVVDNSAYYDDRKLIRTVHLDVETKEFDQMLATLESQVAALGGYIEDMYTYNGSSYSYRSSRNASMTARIPKQQLNAFLDTVSDIGNVVSRSENVEDVTLSYVDMESRKEALQVEQERLMELLGKAESMEDILVIEERLTSVRYQLQSMESQLRTYDNKVDFATVYLNLSEVKELTPVEEETTWERIANGFLDSLKNVEEGFVDFFVWIVVSIPYLLLWAIFIAVIVLIIRLCIRRSKKKKAEKLAQMQQAYAQSVQTQQDQAAQELQTQPVQEQK